MINQALAIMTAVGPAERRQRLDGHRTVSFALGAEVN